jgi:outer membrane protein OmpA-like peptidoglycan-associated protein
LDAGFRYDYYMKDQLDGFVAGVAKDGTFGGFIGIVYFLGAERDTDKDGIPDSRDADPRRPEDFDGFEDKDGAPDVDNDRDGIPDIMDQCPDEAEDIDRFEDDDGCPDLDNDGDGIPDTADQCPDVAEDADGFQDEDGCPDYDNDGDGIPDSLDECANEPETLNAYRDEDGCPDEKPVEITKEKPLILKGVSFALGSAELTPESHAVLDQVAVSLLYYLQVKVEIQGHTDISGRRATNMKLSQKRAQAVLDYLASKGVAPDRMKAVGYGPDRPIADNKTKEGRDQNRRVEIARIN